jgi:hypothetical protein
MTYRDFTYPEVEEALGLRTREHPLFADVPALDPGPELSALIEDGVSLGTALSTEKARSEFIIAPVLFGLRRMLPGRFGLFSGSAFNVDPARGLAGFCDFLMTRSNRLLVIEAPVLAVAEAKIDLPQTGLGQCIAAMVAAREFNARRGVPTPRVYGTSTTGALWMFLRLTGDNLTIDPEEYPIRDLPRILGILAACLRDEVRAELPPGP